MVCASPVRRLLGVLDLLIEVEADSVRRPKGISVQQAAAEVGASRSSANRIMNELVATGYAMPNPAGRGFRVGPSIQIHQGLSPQQRHLSERAHPYLVRLVNETGECAHTAVASGNSVNVIDDVETDQALRVVAGRGRRVPLHCTSAGKVLLAFGASGLPGDFPARTANTITSAATMADQLDKIRRDGYALDDEENDLGVRCISSPVFGSDRDVAIGCVGIDGPSTRVTLEVVDEMAASVRRAAHELSQILASTNKDKRKEAS
ncbi:IclR family transcriptional regulator [Ilumatobacter sp.]|uniref:IclR family transcriptional regulator n=1 Tax=Ilumatobacter sp. TaxID=1967498 RepID=UPI003753BC3E